MRPGLMIAVKQSTSHFLFFNNIVCHIGVWGFLETAARGLHHVMLNQVQVTTPLFLSFRTSDGRG